MARAAAPKPLDLDVIEFATSPHYLGITLAILQRAVLKGLYGLEMTVKERTEYLKYSDGRPPKKGGYREAVLIVGRQSGKTMVAAIILLFECVRWGPALALILMPGKVARAVIISQNIKQAGELRAYVEGMIQTLENPACPC